MRDEPILRFDTHFQDEGLAVPPHDHVLVGVSGGGDSLALLLLLADWRERHPALRLCAATVDHGLRPEAADEADHVAALCASLALPHATLRDSGRVVTSAASARALRFDLLHEHARDLAIPCLALGHTLEDQAETVLMRAMRGGGTAGLAGMARVTRLERDDYVLDIVRPLLGVRRQRLRDYLQSRSVRWIDDPSNDDAGAERVRARAALASAFDTNKINRLALASGRLRSWMDAAVAACLREHLRKNAAGLRMARPSHSTVASHALAACIRHVGTLDYPVQPDRLKGVIGAWFEGRRLRHTIGRCLLVTDGTTMTIERESRHALRPMKRTTITPAFDRRTDIAIRLVR